MSSCTKFDLEMKRTSVLNVNNYSCKASEPN